jgi:hypothetical protein
MIVLDETDRAEVKTRMKIKNAYEKALALTGPALII